MAMATQSSSAEFPGNQDVENAHVPGLNKWMIFFVGVCVLA